MMRCPACDAPNPPESQRCQHCGEKLPPSPTLPAPENVMDVIPALSVSPPDSGKHRPHAPGQIGEEAEQDSPASPGQEEDKDTDIVLTLIPYKNPKALAAYYCGFFALIPVLGFFLGAVAIVLGIRGLQYASVNPDAKGAAHAITGIILGAVAFFCWNPVVCFLFWLTYWYLP